MKLKLEYFENGEELEQITGLSRDELREEGVDFDDWDYGFVTSANITLEQLDDLIPRLLQGCCDNKWRKVRHTTLQYLGNYLKEEQVFWIGLAYHS